MRKHDSLVAGQWQITLENEQATAAFAQRLAAQVPLGSVIFLRGELGVGKTTLCRYFIHALGYRGRVKSPTYTLVEPYPLSQGVLYHFDLYRLAEPSELEYVGYRDYFNAETICMVEWPERGLGMLPEPMLDIEIEMVGHCRIVHCSAGQPQGEG